MGGFFAAKQATSAMADQDAERRRAQAEAKAKADADALKAQQEEEADAVRRGLRGRRALQGAGGELGYATQLGAGG
jgi:hypothetical protein